MNILDFVTTKLIINNIPNNFVLIHILLFYFYILLFCYYYSYSINRNNNTGYNIFFSEFLTNFKLIKLWDLIVIVGNLLEFIY